jgi:predicted DNA-binding protein
MIFIEMKWKKSQHLTVRLNKHQYQRLRDLLKETGLTKSELIRLALAAYMKQ